MTPAEFVERAHAFAQDIWLVQPADIDLMLHKNLDRDKNLATSCLCLGDTNALKEDAWTWYRWGRDGRGDLATVTALACERLHEAQEYFMDYYAFEDTVELLKDAEDALGRCTSHAELRDVAYALEHCLILMHYWTDISIPWAELSPIHAELLRKRGL